MQLKVSYKIALGFSFLVLSILFVGAGGIWGASNINRALNQISKQSLPTVVGSFKQMISLQQANEALLKFMASDANMKSRQQQQELFTQYQDAFNHQLLKLSTSYQLTNQQKQLLTTVASSKEQFFNASQQAMTRHQKKLMLSERLRLKESSYRRKSDSIAAWGQRYLNNLTDRDNAGLIRNFMRSVSQHRNQLINYRQNLDFPLLKQKLAQSKGELSEELQLLSDADSSVRRVAPLVKDLVTDLYNEGGMVSLYGQLYNIQQQLTTQLVQVLQLKNEVQQLADSFIEASLSQASLRRTEADQASEITQTLITILLLANVILALVIATLTVRSIHKPLLIMSNKLMQVADGDMRVVFDTKAKDEFGELGRALNLVVANLHHMLKEITTGSQQLTVVAENNADTSDLTHKAMGQQSQQLMIIASASEEIESTVREVSLFAQKTQDAVQNCDQRVYEAVEHVQATANCIETQAKEVFHAVALTDQLNQYSEQIGKIIDTIGGIAEQTNLLALNASIEAARAGEQGRGFAVVADEVRGLANRTHHSTQEIHEMVVNMRGAIAQVVTAMQESVTQTEFCVETAQNSQLALSQMKEAIKNISDMSIHISEATGQQNEAVAEMARNLEGINEAATETATGAAKVSTHSNQLLQISQQQKLLIENFIV